MMTPELISRVRLHHLENDIVFNPHLSHNIGDIFNAWSRGNENHTFLATGASRQSTIDALLAGVPSVTVDQDPGNPESSKVTYFVLSTNDIAAMEVWAE